LIDLTKNIVEAKEIDERMIEMNVTCMDNTKEKARED
jgi:hypothetical protein